MVFSETLPILVREPCRESLTEHRIPSSKSSMYMTIAAVCVVLLAGIAVSSQSFDTSSTMLEESSVELFKKALASQQADLAKHRKSLKALKESAIKSGTLIDGFHSKSERLSDAKLFKDAVKEQHDDLAKQRAAESTAKALARKGGNGRVSILDPGSDNDSDASLLKDAIKEQQKETKKV
jgi:hypothetical protein